MIEQRRINDDDKKKLEDKVNVLTEGIKNAYLSLSGKKEISGEELDKLYVDSYEPIIDFYKQLSVFVSKEINSSNPDIKNYKLINKSIMEFDTFMIYKINTLIYYLAGSLKVINKDKVTKFDLDNPTINLEEALNIYHTFKDRLGDIVNATPRGTNDTKEEVRSAYTAIKQGSSLNEEVVLNKYLTKDTLRDIAKLEEYIDKDITKTYINIGIKVIVDEADLKLLFANIDSSISFFIDKFNQSFEFLYERKGTLNDFAKQVAYNSLADKYNRTVVAPINANIIYYEFLDNKIRELRGNFSGSSITALEDYICVTPRGIDILSEDITDTNDLLQVSEIISKAISTGSYKKYI